MIHCRNLSKKFKTYIKEPGIRGALKSFFKREYRISEAVKSFDLDVEPGEFIGLLGPNGAGKTTLMKMFTGIIAPSSGELTVINSTPFERQKAFRQKIALVMGQKSQLWWDIPAEDSFILLQKYYELEEKNFRKKLNELAEILDVKNLLQIHVRRLSLGERMKMELMACLLHDPEVVFLDEPTIGLDIVAQRNIREFLKHYQKTRKTTMILTSHYMADVEALCDRVVLILAGKKSFDGHIKNFEKILGKEKFVSISFSNSVSTNDPIWQKLSPVWNSTKNYVELRISEEELREVTVEILKQYPVVDFYTEKLPIERVMETLISRPEILV